jgi:glycosyltransferase involved in cell wall biosynthesis
MSATRETESLSEDCRRVAVLLPCYNEEKTVGQVVMDFRAQLPAASIYVFDNNSSDCSAQVAQRAGAIVVREMRQGKGHVIRSMFRKIDADIYVMVDADSTYPATAVQDLIHPVIQGYAEMAVGDRISSTYDCQNKRKFHTFGNRLVRFLVNKLFGSKLNDVMSGYRVLSRSFVKSFPVISEGFEVETEMTLHALEHNFQIVEKPVEYSDRPKGSLSKLRTFTDGTRVLRTILVILKHHRPLLFLGSCGLIVATLGIATGILPVMEYIRYRYVFRVPMAVLSAALELMGMLLFCCGLILDTAARQHRQVTEVLYQLHTSRLRCYSGNEKARWSIVEHEDA